MIVTAMSTALGGMQKAAAQFEDAARQIVTAPAKAQAASLSGTGGGTNLSDETGLALTTGGFGDNALVQGLVDMKLAEISYKASAKVFVAANNMMDALLDIIS